MKQLFKRKSKDIAEPPVTVEESQVEVTEIIAPPPMNQQAVESSDSTENQQSVESSDSTENQQSVESSDYTENQQNSLPILDIPAYIFEEEVPRFRPDITLQDTKEYIGILLKELETTRQENAQLKIPKQEGKNPWKVLTAALLLLLIVGTIWYFYRISVLESRPVINNNPTSAIVMTPTAVPVAEPETRFTIVDLPSYVSQVPEETVLPFQISAEKYYGYEYLVLSYQKIKIYYRNEYPIEEDNRRRILIDNGITMCEFDWEYDLTGNIKDLVPMYGSFGQDITSQLLFIRYSKDYQVFPEEMHFIDVGTLHDYGTIHTASVLKDMFQLDFTEPDNLMTLSYQSIPYTYQIQKENYIDAVYYEEEIIRLEKYFDLQVSDAGIIFHTVVYLDNNIYLGELSGAVIKNQLQFSISNVKYGAYVTESQDDYGSDGVIVPRSVPMSRKVVINGRNRERYLIEVSDEIVPSVIRWDNWVEQEGKPGIYQYVVDGKVSSIRGIDVSKYQGEIDWEKVKADGVDFAMIRLGYRGYGEGTLELDPYYLTNVKNATDAGIKVGVYFFSQAITAEEAVEEADMVLKYIKDYPIDYPVVIDTEEVTTYDARANILTRKERTDICITFCEHIREAGYLPMIYANTRYMIMGLELERLLSYDKWFAYYGNDCSFPYEFQMYQYSDTGTVDGIEGHVDLNVSFVDYSDSAWRE